SELQNAWADRTAGDHAERVRAAQRCSRIAAPQAVGHIEGLGAKLDLLAFANLELPGYRLTPIPVSRTDDAGRTDISVRTNRGSDERSLVEIVRQRRTISVSIRIHLLRTLSSGIALKAVQRHVRTHDEVQRRAASLLINRREGPAGRDHIQRAVRKFRRR